MSHPLLAMLLTLPLTCAAADVFQLEQLMKSAEKYPAPPSLRKHMAADRPMQSALLRCQQDARAGLANIEDFFASQKIDLGPAGAKSSFYLVFPSTYCPDFFPAAKSIPVWILEKQADGGYREIYAASQDTLELLASRSNGYRDISVKQGFQPAVVVRFNGTAYR